MAINLTKAELIQKLSTRINIPEVKAKEALDIIVQRIIESLTIDNEVILSGFGGPITIKRKAQFSDKASNGTGQIDSVREEEKLSSTIKKSQPVLEQRKLERRNFILDLEIIDRDTDQVVGDLGDITTEGIMLVSDQPVEEDKLFHFKITLPAEAGECLDIVFDAKSIHCRKTVHESIFTTGFTIENLDQNNLKNITHIIEKYAV